MAIIGNGKVILDSLSQPVQNLILSAVENAMKARATKVCTTHFLQALLHEMNDMQKEAFQSGLDSSAQVSHVEEIIRTNTQPRSGASSLVFTSAMSDFSSCAQGVFEFLEKLTTSAATEVIPAPVAAQDISVLHLWLAVLSFPEIDDKNGLVDIFYFDKAREAFQTLTAKEIVIQIPPLYRDSADEELLLEYFNEASIDILQRSAERAGETGYEKVMPAHIFMAIVARHEGLGEWLVRRQAKLGVSPAKVVEEVERNISLGYHGKPKALELNKRNISTSVQRAFEDAYRKIARQGKNVVDESSLMYGILVEESNGRVADILKLPALEMDIHTMLRHLDQYAQGTSASNEAQQSAPLLLPKSLVRSEDLTFLAQTGRLSSIVKVKTLENDLPPIELIKRGLYKRENNHILITGQAGVGKTAVVHELARQISVGEIPFLRRKKILWVDCKEILPEESREKLEHIIAMSKGRNDLIVCLDGFDAIIRYVGQRESNNLSMLKTALQNHHIHLIAIIEDRYYTEFLGSEYQFLKYFTRVEITEPDKEMTAEIVNQLKTTLENTYKVAIEDDAVQKAVVLSRDFILSERLPTKAISTLVDACERASYECEMASQSTNGKIDNDMQTKPLVNAEHVIATVAEKTGIPESTLRGTGENIDFDAILRNSVVGQDRAVEATAGELKLIKGGDADSSKPASIMLFAGLTGTGKTELAKTIAQIYSASKKLTVYTMGNFNESHSVSGIVGVPPGYVGYEMGGRLINDLNADPYSVVLLDEVEKAHPDIWKPFLNLFDEGWIVDQRNIKAYGNRAIIILTSNVGADKISELLTSNADMTKVIDAAKQELYDYVHPTSRQKCFTPEFLARITKIIIFNPLSLEAMEAITILKFKKLKKNWQEKHRKELDIHQEVAKHIAVLGYRDNEKSNGREGGRIIPKHIRDMIELPLRGMINQNSEEFKRARKVTVRLDPAGRILCAFDVAQPETVEEIGKHAAERIRAILAENTAFTIDKCLERVETILKEWEQDVRAWASSKTLSVAKPVVDSLLHTIENKRQTFHQRENELNTDLFDLLKSLVKTLSTAQPTKSYYDGPTIQVGLNHIDSVSSESLGLERN